MDFDMLWWFVHNFDLRLTDTDLTMLKMICRAARTTLKAHHPTSHPSKLIISVNMIRWTRQLGSRLCAVRIGRFWREKIVRLDRVDLLPEVLSYPYHDDELCQLAASKNSLKCLTYFHELNPCGDETCIRASAAGASECLQYLLQNGCSRDNEDITYAAYRNNHLECLRSALKNGCPLSMTACKELGTFAADEEDGYNACETYLLTNYAHRIHDPTVPRENLITF